jgi:hypothetical protein
MITEKTENIDMSDCEYDGKCSENRKECLSCNYSKKAKTGCTLGGYCAEKGVACLTCPKYKYKKSNKRSKRAR